MIELEAEVCLEPPESAAAHKEIMLPGLSGGRQGKIRLARPEIADLSPNADSLPHSHIEPDSGLYHRIGRRLPGIGRPIHQALALAEVSEARAQTHPRRNRRGRKQIHPSRRSDEQLLVVVRDDGMPILSSVQIHVRVVHNQSFGRNRPDRGHDETPRVLSLQCESLAGVNNGIEECCALDALIADERPPNQSADFVSSSCANADAPSIVTTDRIATKSRLADISPPARSFQIVTAVAFSLARQPPVQILQMLPSVVRPGGRSNVFLSET